MECKRSAANNEVAKERDEKDLVMPISVAIQHSHDGEVDEDEICERVHHLGDVSSEPVVFLTPTSRGLASVA